MENEGSPLIEEVGAPNVMEVSRPEGQAVRSSSRGSYDSRPESAADMQEEGNEAVDPCKSSWSYVFGPSTITVGRIRKTASLYYFDEGDVRESREEVILEPADYEAIVFEEIFTTGLRMPPQPALINILHMFWV
jgi:hypothetical protein